LKDNSERPPEIIEDGILPYQSMLLIAGAKKVRKTFLAYNFGIAIAGGYSFAGFKTNKEHKVLIFSAEGGYYPNRDRIKKMCECADIKNPNNFNICFDSRIKLEDDQSYDFIIEKIKELKSEVIIIDPFVKFHHLEENSAMDMGNILGKLRYLIEDYGISIILVHHLGKDQSRDARGSSAILGEYDSCITLFKDGNDDKNRIEFDLRHSISPEPRGLIFNQEMFWFFEDISPIVLLINEHGPMNKQDLVDLCIEKKLYKSSGAYKAIDRAVKKEQIKLNSNKLYEVVQS
jgi:RecA-family ATPase